ncbi:hypothetical protein CKO28_12065 [Rhodovibrio sodomensis]|uniref:DUF4159 domain-containing protein n=1 Tax=Rhodovibrio sodomensis TaxID=1088 RepID=A0ABS1DHA0_9PROT|nr:DUF4159 domain-containing protein [Rhodovibrio sodomensis]MBK1668765.1 hypothetical protein [Rhodovibrio sodomensis]
MAALGSLAFAQPWLLLALLALPALWFLLRVTPPAPKTQRFPAIRLLLGLAPTEETPARTPWWLLLLRLLAAALVIVGLAGPVMHPATQLSGSGPLVLVIDNGWASAKTWSERMQVAEAQLDRAAREQRRVRLLTTAPARPDAPLAASDLLRPERARERIRALQPHPWPSDYAAARSVVEDLQIDGSAHVVWLNDGLQTPETEALASRLQRLGRLELMRPEPADLPVSVLPPSRSGTDLKVQVRRAAARGQTARTVIASDERGRLVATAEASFDDGSRVATATFELPLELRNRITRVGVQGENTAASVALLDSRWQRRPVGLVTESAQADAQPLLSEVYYLERALAPYAEVTRGNLSELLAQDRAMIVLSDRGALRADLRNQARAWVERGGVLLRFAGPKLARELTGPEARAGEGTPLLPVRLRRGGRALSGTMSWGSPPKLADFPADSPFAGLSVPDELTIERQVLAQPSLELGEKTWARLADGTPLVTADQRGDGWVVLVHTTANAQWSNLPLSGLFVQMLRRIVSVGEGVAETADTGPLPPSSVLDGFGQLGPAPASVQALSTQALETNAISAAHPPGLYGLEGQRRAHNLGPAVGDARPLTALPAGVEVSGFQAEPEQRFGPWLLVAALVLLLIDLGIALLLRGLFGPAGGDGMGRRAARAAGGGAAAILLAVALAPAPALAQSGGGDAPESYALKATLDTRLAYVVTGVDRVDRISEQGLRGLSRTLTARTSIEPAAPLPVRLDEHPLAFFPLLYWPVTDQQAPLSTRVERKVNDYLANGGTILFDLRDPTPGVNLGGGLSGAGQALRALTRNLDIPPLKPVPPEHVLTKAFYLLNDFPGRYDGGQLWVEDTSAGGGDGDNVASVLVGYNDYAGAWAIDQAGRARFAVTPGGERQREMAFRVGVNLVMYAMTGNYKADQVHIPAILERLGQ